MIYTLQCVQILTCLKGHWTPIGIGLFWPWWWTIFPPLSEHVQKSCSLDLFLLVKCLMAPTVLIQKWFLPIQCEECCKQNYLERFRLIIGLVIWIKSWNVTCCAITKVHNPMYSCLWISPISVTLFHRWHAWDQAAQAFTDSNIFFHCGWVGDNAGGC